MPTATKGPLFAKLTSLSSRGLHRDFGSGWGGGKLSCASSRLAHNTTRQEHEHPSHQTCPRKRKGMEHHLKPPSMLDLRWGIIKNRAPAGAMAKWNPSRSHLLANTHTRTFICARRSASSFFFFFCLSLSPFSWRREMDTLSPHIFAFEWLWRSTQRPTIFPFFRSSIASLSCSIGRVS